jgi:hypothetical protein
MNNFFDQDGLRSITDTWRDQHVEDGIQYGQVAEVMLRRLGQQKVDGDGLLSAKRRARKVSRQAKRMEKYARKTAAAAEALYATFVNEVAELPDRRARQIEAKENRKQRLGLAGGVHETVAKSLDASARAFNGGQPVGNPQVNAAPQPQYVSPYPHQFAQPAGSQQSLPDMADLFVDFPEAL